MAESDKNLRSLIPSKIRFVVSRTFILQWSQMRKIRHLRINLHSDCAGIIQEQQRLVDWYAEEDKIELWEEVQPLGALVA